MHIINQPILLTTIRCLLYLYTTLLYNFCVTFFTNLPLSSRIFYWNFSCDINKKSARNIPHSNYYEMVLNNQRYYGVNNFLRRDMYTLRFYFYFAF
jgi:hypothetical protein